MTTAICQECDTVHAVGMQENISHHPLEALFIVFYYLNKQLMDRLQSVQNAGARLIFGARRYDHVQPLLWSLHWLRVPERISFRLAVLVYRCLHGSAPCYLASDLQRISDLGARRRLRSSTTLALVAPRTVHATIGDRAFPAAAASVWNSLPETVRSSPSLPVFHSGWTED